MKADETARLCKAFGTIAKVLEPLTPAERERVFAAIICLFVDVDAKVVIEGRKGDA